jgi:hypothetical protein
MDVADDISYQDKVEVDIAPTDHLIEIVSRSQETDKNGELQ